MSEGLVTTGKHWDTENFSYVLYTFNQSILIFVMYFLSEEVLEIRQHLILKILRILIRFKKCMKVCVYVVIEK